MRPSATVSDNEWKISLQINRQTTPINSILNEFNTDCVGIIHCSDVPCSDSIRDPSINKTIGSESQTLIKTLKNLAISANSRAYKSRRLKTRSFHSAGELDTDRSIGPINTICSIIQETISFSMTTNGSDDSLSWKLRRLYKTFSFTIVEVSIPYAITL